VENAVKKKTGRLCHVNETFKKVHNVVVGWRFGERRG
jgi:hypothetical protein